MQVVYIMGLFMFIFSVIMGITATLTRTAMQTKLDNVAQVEKMFLDIERGINNGILSNQSDLRFIHNRFRHNQNRRFYETASCSSAPCPKDDLNAELVDYVNWTEDQLVTDPWGTVIRVLYSTEFKYLERNVEAPITSFAYISAGPNKTFETDLATITTNNISSLEVTDSDDILYVFNTYDAMARTWNIMTKAIDGVVGLVQTNYTEQYVDFLPRIEIYNENQFDTVPGFGFDNDDLNAWLTALAGEPGYPEIVTDMDIIGGATYFQAAPRFGSTPASNLVTIHRSNAFTADVGVTITPSPSSAVGWRINFRRIVDGRAIISN